MSPLSALSPAGINVRSPFPKPSNTFSPGQQMPDNMTETQENTNHHSDNMDIDSATIKHTSPTRKAPIAGFGQPLQPITNRNTLDMSQQEQDDMGSNDNSMAESNGFDPDNTCFSTFSAVPNADVTNYTRQGLSTGLMSTPGRETPIRDSRLGTPGTAMPVRSLSPNKPSRLRDDATTQLLEFSGEINIPTQSGSRPSSPLRPRGQDMMTAAGHRMRSPEGRAMNLLDFDLPPAPTPRSIPTISARELESLKAGFLSEISSLKAKLSGAQAEITSLKDAKDDAERRVGSLSEELRDVQGAKTALQQEKEDWQKHDVERREALAKLKQEYVAHEEEISRLREDADEQNKKFQDMENRAADAEGQLQEAEGKLAGFREGAINGNDANPTTPGSNKAVEVAVEKVAKELHLLYKSKHEQKVTALKQSYEKRWKKKVDELAFKVEELEKENATVRDGRETNLSGEAAFNGAKSPRKEPESSAKVEELQQEIDTLKKDTEELNKRMEIMSRGVTMLERDNVSLKTELEDSRRENSELVSVVDEMLAIDLAAPTSAPSSRPVSQETASSISEPAAIGIKPVPSQSKISGLRGPGFGGYGESRIGGGNMSLKRSTSGSGPRSGIMSNIERMGRGIGGRGGQE